jgi:hypothetical protein
MGAHTTFHCHASSDPFWLRQFLWLLLFLMAMTVLSKYWSDVLQNVCKLRFVWHFAHGKFEDTSFGEKTTEVKCYCHHIIAQRTCSILIWHCSSCWLWSPDWGRLYRASPVQNPRLQYFHTTVFGRKTVCTAPLKQPDICSIFLGVKYPQIIWSSALWSFVCSPPFI